MPHGGNHNSPWTLPILSPISPVHTARHYLFEKPQILHILMFMFRNYSNVLSCLAHYWTLKIEAACSYEILTAFQ